METSSKSSSFTSASSVTTSPRSADPAPHPPAGGMGAAPPKAWYASAGVWGALVTLGGSALALLKVEVDPALLADVREWVLAAATLLGGAVALWGRLRASRRIGPPDDGAPRPPTLPPPTAAVGLRVRVLMLPFLVAPALLAGAGGCVPTVGASAPYVAADRATFDAVAPEYRAYVGADASLDAERRDRRIRTLELWRVRLEDAEGRQLSPHAGAERKRGDERSAAPDTSADSP